MPKSMNYAILEAIQGEMRRDKLLTLLYEYQRPGNLEAEFGPWRVRFCRGTLLPERRCPRPRHEGAQSNRRQAPTTR